MNETPNPPPPTPNPPLAPAPASPLNENQIRQWHMWTHLSALGGLVVPFGSILGPLIIWQIKKDEIPSIVPHGKAALNFHLTVLIANAVSVVLMILLWLLCLGWLLIPVLFVINICAIVFSIIAALKANEGGEYRYPCSLTLIT